MNKRTGPYRSGYFMPAINRQTRPTQVRESIKEFINNGIKIDKTFSKNKLGDYIYTTNYYDETMMIYLRKLKILGILEDSGRSNIFIKKFSKP